MKRSKQSNQSKQSKQKIKNVALQQDIGSIIVPIAILTLFAVLIGMTIVNRMSSHSNMQNGASIEDKMWEDAFHEAEKNRVGIIFNPISTTDNEYERLRIECNDYIQDNREGKRVDAEVEVDTVIDEAQFIDINSENTKEVKEQKEMSETGPIYFQDMLMLRYINTDGDLKVITGLFDEDKQNIEIVRQNKIAEAVQSNNISPSKIQNTEVIDNNEKLSYTTEEEYLDKIDDTLKAMLLANSFEEIRAAESMAMNYFTVEGKQTVFGNRKDIKLSAGATIETSFTAAGKSDSSKTYKDRIYVQLKVKVDNEEFDTYIILKLNNILRIYDIDII